MKYMLMIFGNEGQEQAYGQEAEGRMMAAYGAYTEAMGRPASCSGDRLKPTASATTVRAANGKTEVLNGPYAETKEQLGGYYIIDVPDLTRPFRGRHDALAPAMARSKSAPSGRCRLRPWRQEDAQQAQQAQQAKTAAERVARESYGKLVAFLAARTRDLAGAEDALSDAFAAALVDWPTHGVPSSPEAGS